MFFAEVLYVCIIIEIQASTFSSVTSDDLELRVFRDPLRFDEAVGLESVELYVQ